VVEVFFVDQGVRRRRMRYAVGCATEFDEGFGQPGAAAKVRSETC